MSEHSIEQTNRSGSSHLILASATLDCDEIPRSIEPAPEVTECLQPVDDCGQFLNGVTAAALEVLENSELPASMDLPVVRSLVELHTTLELTDRPLRAAPRMPADWANRNATTFHARPLPY